MLQFRQRHSPLLTFSRCRKKRHFPKWSCSRSKEWKTQTDQKTTCFSKSRPPNGPQPNPLRRKWPQMDSLVMNFSSKSLLFSVFYNRSGHFSWKPTFPFPRFEKLFIEDFEFWPQKPLGFQETTGVREPLSGSSRCCQKCRLFLWIMLLGWGTTLRELKVLSKNRWFSWIETLSVDFPLWTARDGMCPTGQVSFKKLCTRIVF